MPGERDEFFGSRNSVASVMANVRRSTSEVWGSDDSSAQVQGNTFEAMKRANMKEGLVVVVEGAHHDLTLSHDNLVRQTYTLAGLFIIIIVQFVLAILGSRISFNLLAQPASLLRDL